MDQSPRPLRRYGALAAVGAAGLVAGAVLVGTTSANAADATPSPTATSGTQGTAPGYGTPPQDGTGRDGTGRDGTGRAGTGHGPGGHGQGVPGGAESVRPDEQAVSGSTLTTLKAKALEAVPGGTVVRVETDAGDGAYEAHMTKADGTVVTVKFDKNLSVIEVQDGMGTGDPQLAPPTGSAPDGSSSGSSSAAPSASPPA